MNMTEQEFNYQKEHLTAQMIQILAEERGLSLEDAIDKVYSSEIYKKLSDQRTGFFSSRPVMCCHILKWVLLIRHVSMACNMELDENLS